MRTLLAMALLTLTGCTTFVGPRERAPDRADDPLLCPAEQKRKARYLLPYADPELSPRDRDVPATAPVGP